MLGELTGIFLEISARLQISLDVHFDWFNDTVQCNQKRKRKINKVGLLLIYVRRIREVLASLTYNLDCKCCKNAVENGATL